MRVTFSRRAKADVRAIWNYTAEFWGEGQAKVYIELIETAVQAIAADPKLGRPCDDVREGVRRHLVGSHMLFYRVKGKGLFMVRILHQKMDFTRYL